jgi:hypothetical protein
VDSLADLKAAYPSYYGDTEAFLLEVTLLLSPKRKIVNINIAGHGPTYFAKQYLQPLQQLRE